MRCPHCGHENPPGTQACAACQRPLPPLLFAPDQPSKQSARGLYLGLLIIAVMVALTISALSFVGLRELSGPIHLNRAKLYQQREQYARAAEEYLRVLERDPHNLQARLNRVEALLQLGRKDEALAELAEAARVAPNDPLVHWRRARLLTDLKRYTEALPSLQRAAQLAPQNAGFWLDLGVTQYRLGKLQECLATYRKLLERDPGNLAAHDNLGYTYFDLGQFKEAVREWRKAVSSAGPRIQDQGLADAWAGLAIGMLALGDQSQAVAAYQRAVNMEPHYLDEKWMADVAIWSEQALKYARRLMPKAQRPAPPPRRFGPGDAYEI